MFKKKKKDRQLDDSPTSTPTSKQLQLAKDKLLNLPIGDSYYDNTATLNDILAMLKKEIWEGRFGSTKMFNKMIFTLGSGQFETTRSATGSLRFKKHEIHVLRVGEDRYSWYIPG
jgi:hypothetical protein